MLKKLAIVSAIVLLACLIITSLLVPKAIADTVALAERLSPQYEELTEQVRAPAEGAAMVTMDGGYGYYHLDVVPSPDGSIHLYTDGFHWKAIQYSYRLEGDTGIISASSSWDYNPWRELTRENFLKQLVQEFSGHTPRTVLQLPAGVAFDTDSSRHTWSMTLDEGVETVSSGRYDWMDEEPLPSADEELPEETDDPLEPDPETGLTAQQRLDMTRAALDANNLMWSRYSEYAFSAVGEKVFWEEADNLLNNFSAVIAPLSGGREEWELEEFQVRLYDYLYAMTVLNLRTFDQENLALSYQEGRIDKEEYYIQDLEYDRLREEQRALVQNLDADGELERFMADAEEDLGFKLVFGRELTLEGLEKIR